MAERHQYLLDESRVPKAWYNINADLPVPPAPILHPGTMEPVTPEFLGALLPMSIIMQQVSTERWIEIPEPVREVYRLWRPTPLLRAVRLERALDTPAHIYYKYEGTSPVGSHKANTAVAQCFYNKEVGAKTMVTETGAGQWGSAMAMAANFFGMDAEIFMVRISHDQKPYRRILMENYGATVHASPTRLTTAGRAALAEDPNGPGVLGLAISEAMETVVTSGGTKSYGPGSCLGFVLLHQSVIGIETLEQMEMAGEYPDVIVACAGGGSNFGGFAYPFVHQNLTNGTTTRIIAVEPTSCPTLTQGQYAYDWADHARMAPITKMHTLGHDYVPQEIHAGGLRYHGMAPSVSALYDHGAIEARAVSQLDVFASAVQFSRAEGIVPAPESAYAIKVAIDEALACKQTGEKKVIVFNLSGHGHFDMLAYQDYHAGALTHDAYEPASAPHVLPGVPNAPAASR